MSMQSKLLVRVERSLFVIPWSELTLEPGEYIIGRSPYSHILIPDRLVSRRHARLFYKNGKWFIEDLGSRNGTIVNGSDIRGQGFKVIPDGGVHVVVGGTLLFLKPIS